MKKYVVGVLVYTKDGSVNGDEVRPFHTLEEAREEYLKMVESEYNHLTYDELKNNEYEVYIDMISTEEGYRVEGVESCKLYADRYAVRCAESGSEIEHCQTLGDAGRTIQMYEYDDKEDGIYEEGFYEIYDRTLEEVI